MRRGRVRREPEATRDRLLDAAARVFMESGYDGARVVDIAREAGVTTGAIYAHFRDKADLLVKTLAERGVDHAAGVLVRDTAVPVASMLRTLAQITVAGELHPTEVLLLDAAVAARRERELRERLGSVLREHAGEVAGMVERAREQHVVASDVSTQAIVRFLLMLQLGSIVTRMLGAPPPDPSEWTRLIGRLLEGVAPRPAQHGRAPRRGRRAPARSATRADSRRPHQSS
ncbi:HTH-type transcriptional regulator AcrR [Myxococcaceae bacterium]|jgi:AcrR family transcriptional regulator|nr:HTH-type transcriptional regulator AcrR [Myxococcaceae bacterium]